MPQNISDCVALSIKIDDRNQSAELDGNLETELHLERCAEEPSTPMARIHMASSAQRKSECSKTQWDLYLTASPNIKRKSIYNQLDPGVRVREQIHEFLEETPLKSEIVPRTWEPEVLPQSSHALYVKNLECTPKPKYNPKPTSVSSNNQLALEPIFPTPKPKSQSFIPKSSQSHDQMATKLLRAAELQFVYGNNSCVGRGKVISTRLSNNGECMRTDVRPVADDDRITLVNFRYLTPDQNRDHSFKQKVSKNCLKKHWHKMSRCGDGVNMNTFVVVKDTSVSNPLDITNNPSIYKSDLLNNKMPAHSNCESKFGLTPAKAQSKNGVK